MGPVGVGGGRTGDAAMEEAGVGGSRMSRRRVGDAAWKEDGGEFFEARRKEG